MSNAFDADVILGGGGLVGQTLALALDQAGLSVAVIDASKPSDTLAPTFDGRAFAIAFASFRMWRALGVADQIDALETDEIAGDAACLLKAEAGTRIELALGPGAGG